VLTMSQPKSLCGRSEIIVVALAIAALLAAEWVLTSVIPGHAIRPRRWENGAGGHSYGFDMVGSTLIFGGIEVAARN